jgi:hypothetical protein
MAAAASRFLAHAPTQVCIPANTVLSDPLVGTLTICSEHECNDAPGCPVTLAWHDVVASGDRVIAPVAISSDVDVSLSGGVGGAQACTLALRSTTSVYSATLGVAFSGSNASVQVVEETTDAGDTGFTGCSVIADILDLSGIAAFNVLAVLPPDFAYLGALEGTCNPEPCIAGFCDGATGTCTEGPVSCDDSNPCTADSCDPSVGCVATPAPDGTPCGDPCTNDTCLPSTCAAGTCSEQEGLCDGAEKAVFADGVDDYFAAHLPTELCVSRTTVGNVEVCAQTTCNGAPGCQLDLHWSNVASSTDHLEARVDLVGTLGLTATFFGIPQTCTLSVSALGSLYSADYAVVTQGNELGLMLSNVDPIAAPFDLSGCAGLADVANVIAPLVDNLHSGLLASDPGNLANYEKTCE